MESYQILGVYIVPSYSPNLHRFTPWASKSQTIIIFSSTLDAVDYIPLVLVCVYLRDCNKKLSQDISHVFHDNFFSTVRTTVLATRTAFKLGVQLGGHSRMCEWEYDIYLCIQCTSILGFPADPGPPPCPEGRGANWRSQTPELIHIKFYDGAERCVFTTPT